MLTTTRDITYFRPGRYIVDRNPLQMFTPRGNKIELRPDDIIEYTCSFNDGFGTLNRYFTWNDIQIHLFDEGNFLCDKLTRVDP